MIGFLRGWRHARLRRLLSTFVDGSASGAERVEVEAHLSGCEACRMEADALRATVDLLAALPEAVPSRSFALDREPEPVQSVSPLVWTARVAAPAAALLLVALVVGNATGIIGQGDGLSLLGGMDEEVIREVMVEKEVIREVPVEKIVEVEKEVVRTVVVEKPVEVIKEVVKEVEVPGETVVVEVEKEVVRAVEVEKPVEAVREAKTEETVSAKAVVAEAMAESAEPTQVTADAPALTATPEPAGLSAPTATVIPTPTMLSTPTAVPTPTVTPPTTVATSTATAAPTPTVVPMPRAAPAAVSEPTSVPAQLFSPELEAPSEEAPRSAADRYDDAEGRRLPLWEIGVAVVLVLLAALAGGFWAARRGSWRR